MSSAVFGLAVPRGAYTERVEPRRVWLDETAGAAMGPMIRWVRARDRRWTRIVALVASEGAAFAGAGSRRLQEAANDLRAALHREGLREDLVARTFAVVREAATQTLGLRHFDVQLIGGRILLAGIVAEMETGEGKTLTATLPACTMALAGVPVHVITVNDYLVQRDADWMGPIYRALGLTVGAITHGMDAEERRAAYACDITYCTNKEIVFDYLRDRLVLGRDPSRIQLRLERLSGQQARPRQLLLRGLSYGLVDEADSVLVDEARTPLIISGTVDETPERRLYETALALAGKLGAGTDFVIDGRDRSIRITDAGQMRLEDLARPLGGVFTGRQRCEELVRQALVAQHLFHRDRHYLVADGKVQIIDEYTGRVMADRSWEHGLHQLIEAKEGCPLTSRQASRARMSYQRFFRRYVRLAGMTGTAREVSRELWSVYRLAVVRVPTNRPLVRRRWPDHIYATAEARWAAVVEHIETIHRRRRPVLVGTRSVEASEHLSALLVAAQLPHRVLNARQDREEAEIIAQAGEPGRITVATNMAGRGTDIALASGVASLGGLHVIATERHEAGRIDRQLFGRCARQGDPGSHEAMVSLDDELLTTYGGVWRRLALVASRRRRVATWLGALAVRRAQRRAERVHARLRRDLLTMDERRDTALAFSGRFD